MSKIRSNTDKKKCDCPKSRVTFPTPLGDDMHTPNCATRK